MVSTNNVEITRTRPDPPFFVDTIPHCLCLRREERQMPPEVYYQKISQYSQENTCVKVSFSILLKSDSNADVFLKILGNF